ncbi:hypothetical protein LQ50_05770 [Halalkalibacter okhensis]|uniref:Uncharacterized protein n=1 Tax=Halalkalibacter okhensis TaxID=333138 RepID=A0A0B0IMH0_9BACI|nr:hypothetical protein LQ50_05770 [Halalkalibacter okhensis]
MLEWEFEYEIRREWEKWGNRRGIWSPNVEGMGKVGKQKRDLKPECGRNGKSREAEKGSEARMW